MLPHGFDLKLILVRKVRLNLSKMQDASDDSSLRVFLHLTFQ
jgi:hypothetical protein